jgi:MarR family 2-MHQ and catechol resistance regulon transcriptional repressor
MSADGREGQGVGRRPRRRPSNIHAPVRVASELQGEFPVMDRRATEVLINLIRTESLVGNLLARRFRRYGLSLSGFNALVILRQSHSRLHPHEIADRLLVTRAAVTALLDALEARGYARRLPSLEDGRMSLIEITDRGDQALQELLPEHFAAERAMVACLNANEKELMIGLLGRLQAHLLAQAPEAEDVINE